ncbi:MAG: hypothetical protein KGO49_04400 [Gammaproteobacteria bacterium]|nr:hypothetical protein [Gammaproteobacteria bacterium]
MKFKKNLTPYFLLYILPVTSIFGGIIGSQAIANPTFFQCQLKNGHMTFSDQPCQSNQKTIPSKKAKKSSELQTAPTINVSSMNASIINNPKDCAYLDRLGIKRKYDQRTRTARLKYWRADQADELKEALVNLNKMKDKELEGC